MKTRTSANIVIAAAAIFAIINSPAARADEHRGVVVDRGHIAISLGKGLRLEARIGEPCLPRPAYGYYEDRCAADRIREERIRIEREEALIRERREAECRERERREHEHSRWDHDHDRRDGDRDHRDGDRDHRH